MTIFDRIDEELAELIDDLTPARTWEADFDAELRRFIADDAAHVRLAGGAGDDQ